MNKQKLTVLGLTVACLIAFLPNKNFAQQKANVHINVTDVYGNPIKSVNIEYIDNISGNTHIATTQSDGSGTIPDQKIGSEVTIKLRHVDYDAYSQTFTVSDEPSKRRLNITLEGGRNLFVFDVKEGNRVPVFGELIKKTNEKHDVWIVKSKKTGESTFKTLNPIIRFNKGGTYTIQMRTNAGLSKTKEFKVKPRLPNQAQTIGLITGAGALATSLITKLISNQQYNKHKNEIDFDKKKEQFNTAQNLNKIAVYTLYAGVPLFAGAGLWYGLSGNKGKAVEEIDAYDSNASSIQHQIGITLNF